MTRIKSTLTTKSGEGEANTAEWRRLIDELNLRRRGAAEGGSAKARERHIGRGKLLARERVKNSVPYVGGIRGGAMLELLILRQHLEICLETLRFKS